MAYHGRIKHMLDEVVDDLVIEDPLNPFEGRKSKAKKTILSHLTTETYGKQHPLAQFVDAYNRVDRVLDPVHITDSKLEYAEDLLSQLRSIWEVIEQDIFQQIQDYRSPYPYE